MAAAPLSLREVLANGHGDTYHQYRAGQAFRIGNVPNGIYFISVEANPDDEDGRNLQELDYTNNDSLRKVRLWHHAQGRAQGRGLPGRHRSTSTASSEFRMR